MTGPVLHPTLAAGLVRERHADLLREARAARLCRLVPPRPPSAVRRAVGWRLVELGLRLAVERPTR
jgi:hypothetical protein